MAHFGALQQMGQAPKKKPSVLARVGQGLIAFGRDVPVAQLEQEQLDNSRRRNQVQAGQQQIAQNEQAIAAQDAEAQRQQQIQSLSQIAFSNGPDADKAARQLFSVAPEFAMQVQEGLGIRDQVGLEAAARRAAAIEAQPTKELRDSEILKQINDNPTLDLSDTEQMLGMSFEEQNVPLRIVQGAALSAKQRVGGGGTSKLGQSVVTKDAEGNLSFATPVLTGDEVSTQTTPIGGQIVSRAQGETAQERQQRDVDTAGQKSTAVEISKRDQEFINVGQRQADATAILRRGLQLLDTIGTGRPEAVALAARNLFGIAGADETELNANLGKAILSQLRETFGAQFTENEGKRLESIESNFGKSTVGNQRLLQQTLRLMERDARRGIDVATRVDPFAADEIQNALDFSLDPNRPKVEKPVSEMTDEEIKQAIINAG